MRLHTIRTAVKALRRNPLRAMLTTLGMIVGVGAVIAMMEIGAGSSTAIQRGITSMGANVLVVIPGTAASGGATQGSGSVMTLSPEDCEAIVRGCPSVRAAAPAVRARAQVVHGNRNWVPESIIGTTQAYLDVREWSVLDEGRVFSERDVLSGASVCLLGRTVVDELFGDEAPLGEEIRVRDVPLRVVGVLSEKGANMMGKDQDDVLLAPWTTIKNRVSGSRLTSTNQSISSGSSGAANTLSNPYPGAPPDLYPEQSATQAANNPMLVRFTNIDMIMAAGRSASEIPTAISQMSELLRERHDIPSSDVDDFEIVDMTEVTETLSSTTTLMTNLLLFVAMISLVVGGVGIMNVMLVSVTERTREIGLRMAVGARAGDILGQFLMEAVLLCLLGGALGILLGHSGSYLIWFFLSWPVEASPAVVVVAVLVSVSVGVVFGFYPAWRASRLDPIEALRYE